MIISVVSFGKCCISFTSHLFALLYYIATGSACSVDLAKQFNLLFSSQPDTMQVLCDSVVVFLMIRCFFFQLSYLFFQLHACYSSDCVFKCTDDYIIVSACKASVAIQLST